MAIRTKSLGPTWVVILGLICILLLGIQGRQTYDWLNDGKNQQVILALSAIAQVMFAAVLAVLTYRANRTSLSLATHSMRMAEEDSKRARKIALDALAPYLSFQYPSLSAGHADVLTITVINVGPGPALATSFDSRHERSRSAGQPPLEDPEIVDRSVSTIRTGDSLRLTLRIPASVARNARAPYQFDILSLSHDLAGRTHISSVTIEITPGGAPTIQKLSGSTVLDLPR